MSPVVYFRREEIGVCSSIECIARRRRGCACVKLRVRACSYSRLRPALESVVYIVEDLVASRRRPERESNEMTVYIVDEREAVHLSRMIESLRLMQDAFKRGSARSYIVNSLADVERMIGRLITSDLPLHEALRIAARELEDVVRRVRLSEVRRALLGLRRLVLLTERHRRLEATLRERLYEVVVDDEDAERTLAGLGLRGFELRARASTLRACRAVVVAVGDRVVLVRRRDSKAMVIVSDVEDDGMHVRAKLLVVEIEIVRAESLDERDRDVVMTSVPRVRLVSLVDVDRRTGRTIAYNLPASYWNKPIRKCLERALGDS